MHPLARFLAALAIAAVLLGGSLLLYLPGDMKRARLARRAAVTSLLAQLELACGQYHKAYGAFPPVEQEEGVGALTKALTTPSKGGPCIFDFDPGELPSPKALTDLWGTPLRYRMDQGKPLLLSAGEDGRFGTADDLSAR